jgi:hypothetical protein
MQRRCVTKLKTFKLRFLRDVKLDFYAVLHLSDMRNTLMDMSISWTYSNLACAYKTPMALGEDDHFIPTQLFFRPKFNLAINFYGYPSGYEVNSYRVCPMRWLIGLY